MIVFFVIWFAIQDFEVGWAPDVIKAGTIKLCSIVASWLVGRMMCSRSKVSRARAFLAKRVIGPTFGVH